MKPLPESTPSTPSVDYEGIKATISQPEDTSGRIQTDRQFLEIELIGGPATEGHYVVISTERWAVEDEAEWQRLWQERIQPLLQLARPPGATAPVAAPVPAKRPGKALAVGTELETALQSLKHSLSTLPPPDADGRQPMTLVWPEHLRLVLRTMERFREGNGAIVS